MSREKEILLVFVPITIKPIVGGGGEKVLIAVKLTIELLGGRKRAHKLCLVVYDSRVKAPKISYLLVLLASLSLMDPLGNRRPKGCFDQNE